MNIMHRTNDNYFRHNFYNHFKVLIIGGVHGDEVGSIELAYSFRDVEMYDERLNNVSEITIIPTLNFEALRDLSRSENYSNDLNRGWLSEDVRTLLIKEIENADLIIDLHSSQYVDNIFLIDKTQSNYKKLVDTCVCNGLHYSLRATKNDTIKSFINKKYPDKTAITFEQMGLDHTIIDTNSKSKQLILDFIDAFSNNKRNKSMYDSNDFYDLTKICTCNSEGFVRWYAELGDMIREGSVIAGIKDLENNVVLENIVSPCTGLFVCGYYPSYAKCSTPIAHVQPIKNDCISTYLTKEGNYDKAAKYYSKR